MRFGFFRRDPALPAPDRQIEILTAAGCQGRVLEAPSGAAGARRLDRLLAGLGSGDTVCVVSLDVFDRPLEGLVRTLRDLAERSVSLAIVARNDPEIVVGPDAGVTALLQLLAVCERCADQGGEAPLAWYGRPFLPADDFTVHQRQHALKLYAEGMSLRAIGLIFRTSPDEVLKVVAEGRRHPRPRPAEMRNGGGR